jgi:hypothetical protein
MLKTHTVDLDFEDEETEETGEEEKNNEIQQ